MPLLGIFNVSNMSFKAIWENKIPAKISKFTVFLRISRKGHRTSSPLQ